MLDFYVAMSPITRPTTRSKQSVSLSFYSFLFAEMIAQSVRSSAQTGEHLETRLHRLGVNIGDRSLALFHLRDRSFRRETTPMVLLQFIASQVWRSLFNKVAEVMTTDQPSEIYLVDKGMILNRYISVSGEAAQQNSAVNCANFAAGIIEGMMKTAGFTQTKVDAVFTHAGSLEVMDDPANVTFIVKLDGHDHRKS